MAPFIRWNRAKGSWDKKMSQARFRGACQCLLHSSAPIQVSAVAGIGPFPIKSMNLGLLEQSPFPPP
ncbi:hypothetical protein AMTR_s00001p00272650 [Amborella trichopoda]|uniref:Uncharacterized protein n=1 Tax=Amborella trichopoda TaxID=13333 RepID=W1NLI9_AMBTC|nr:hypothetical protein AMTR_s00001p00272650 [Amborella trichopoda]